MNKTALITGISGQDGAYLAQLLCNKGYSVIGVTRQTERSALYWLDYLGIYDKVTYIKGDLPLR